MLRSVSRPAIAYDVYGLALQRGVVSVGRESEACVRLDSQDVPFLLSRKHSTLTVQPDGSVMLRDLDSTNGTYVARRGQALQKLQPHVSWVLENGDTVAFGGPETIIARRTSVNNPFVFKFYTETDDDDVPQSSMVTQGNCPAVARAGVEVSAPGNAADGDAVSQGGRVEAIEIDLNSPECSARAAAAAATAEPLQAGLEAGTCQHSMPLQQRSIPRAHAAQAAGGAALGSGKENRLTSHVAANAPGTPKSTKMVNILSNHLTCPICQEWLLACHTLSCGHMYCGLCLATWMAQKQSCPSCRKPIAGIPVRCFQVDNTINDLLGVNPMSPGTRNERKRKQAHWDDIQGTVAQDWAAALHRRKETAVSAAQRHHREMMGDQQQQQQPVAAGGAAAAGAAAAHARGVVVGVTAAPVAAAGAPAALAAGRGQQQHARSHANNAGAAAGGPLQSGARNPLSASLSRERR